jgi:SAM-dependent methyltransferase
MSDGLYDDHPAFYDVLQSEWPYDRDLAFVARILDRHGGDAERLLELGCGTGEHACRFAALDLDVVAVDPHAGLLDVARTKCDGDFRRDALPDLSVEGQFDAVVAIRGVVNHLAPGELVPSLSAVAERLAPGGVFVFDNSPLPTDGNHPALAIGTTEAGDYARIAHHVPTADGRLDWRALTLTPDGEFFVDRRPMTPFSDDAIAEALYDVGFEITWHDGYGPDDDRTVFEAVLPET